MYLNGEGPFCINGLALQRGRGRNICFNRWIGGKAMEAMDNQLFEMSVKGSLEYSGTPTRPLG